MCNACRAYLGRTLCSLDHSGYLGGLSVASHYTDELFDVVAAQPQLEQSVLAKCWGSMLVGQMGQGHPDKRMRDRWRSAPATLSPSTPIAQLDRAPVF